jgi:hypothetical protein
MRSNSHLFLVDLPPQRPRVHLHRQVPLRVNKLDDSHLRMILDPLFLSPLDAARRPVANHGGVLSVPVAVSDDAGVASVSVGVAVAESGEEDREGGVEL